MNVIKYGLFVALFFSMDLVAQEESYEKDALTIREIISEALYQKQAYHWLEDFTEKVGPRLTGSAQAQAAVEYVSQSMKALGADTVIWQPVEVPVWRRGTKESVEITLRTGERWKLNATSLGNSVGTPDTGISAPIIEVQSLEEVEKLGKAIIQDKIVFFNRPFDNRRYNAYGAYGGAVDQRVFGASKAAEFGAVGVLVRSITGSMDSIPHTGVTVYKSPDFAIPAIAISTLDAERLSNALKVDQVKYGKLEMDCQNIGTTTSYNVIADFYGRQPKTPYILIGAHLDSWDKGTGAHDDGAGCAHIVEAARLLKSYHLNHNLRIVFFMNEENGLVGGQAYAQWVDSINQEHLFAFESDAGGFVPYGISFDGENEIRNNAFKHIQAWADLFLPYGIQFKLGGSGADIGPLKPQGFVLAGLKMHSHRYFDLHHSTKDTIEEVHPRELSMGAGVIAAFIYMLDKYPWKIE